MHEKNDYINGMKELANKEFKEAITCFTTLIELCRTSCQPSKKHASSDVKENNFCSNCNNNIFCGKLYYHRGFAYLRWEEKSQYEQAKNDFKKAYERFGYSYKKDKNIDATLLLAETMINITICDTRIAKQKGTSDQEISISIIKKLEDEILTFEKNTKDIPEEKEQEVSYLKGRLYYEVGKRLSNITLDSNITDASEYLEKAIKNFTEAIGIFKTLENKEEGSYIIRTIANLMLALYKQGGKNEEIKIKELFTGLKKEYANLDKEVTSATVTEQTLFRVSTFDNSYNASWMTQGYGLISKIQKEESLSVFKDYMNQEIEKSLKASKDKLKGTYYKFYSLNTNSFNYLLENIKDQKIFFATPDIFNKRNDTQDITVLRNIIIKNNDYAELFRDFLRQMNPKVFCMTETYRNYALWLHYADNFKGICVEYEFEENDIDIDLSSTKENKDVMQQYIQMFSDKYLFSKIVYKTEEQFNKLKQLDNASNITGVINNILFAKYDHFSYEKEYRIVKLCANDVVENGLVSLEENFPTIEYENKLKGKINTIYLGNRNFEYDSTSKGLKKGKDFDGNESTIKNMIDILNAIKSHKTSIKILQDRSDFSVQEIEVSESIKSLENFIKRSTT